MNSDIQKKLETFVSQIVKDLGFTPESITVTGEETAEKTDIQVIVKGTDLELLIGYHGKNLQALHHLTVATLKRMFPPETRVSLFLDVGDYFEKQNDKIRQQVTQAVEEVKLLDEAYEFPPMPPRLRRVVHLEAEKHTDVKTESKGEGMNRRVVIYPKNALETTPTA